MKKKSSKVWNFFTVVDKIRARCNYCHKIFNYQASVTNLGKHAKRKHPEVVQQFKNQNGTLGKEDNSSTQLACDTSNTILPVVEFETDSANCEKETVLEQPHIWRHFTKIDDTFSECNHCKIRLPCKNSVKDLIMHVKIGHPGIELKFALPEKNDTKNRHFGLDSINENCHSLFVKLQNVSNSDDEISVEDSTTGTTLVNSQKGNRRTSPVWQYFTYIDKNYAECKICHEHISHKSTRSNLMKHARRKHKPYLITSYHARQMGNNLDIDDDSVSEADARRLNQSKIFDHKEKSENAVIEEPKQTKKRKTDFLGPDKKFQLHQSKLIKLGYTSEEELNNSVDPMIYVEAELGTDSGNEDIPSFFKTQDELKALKVDTGTEIFESTSKNRKSKPMGQNASFVQKFYSVLENGSHCIVCGLVMSNKTSTAALLSHVKNHLLAAERVNSEKKVYPDDIGNVGQAGKNQLPDMSTEEISYFPIIRNLHREIRPISNHTDHVQRVSESQIACSSLNPAESPLTLSLVNAVKERNHRITESMSSQSDELQITHNSIDTVESLLDEYIATVVEEEKKFAKSIFTQSDQIDCKIGESQTACSSIKKADSFLSEPLVNAVTEGNQLLRNVLSVLERQGETLNRIAACLEGMNKVKKTLT